MGVLEIAGIVGLAVVGLWVLRFVVALVVMVVWAVLSR